MSSSNKLEQIIRDILVGEFENIEIQDIDVIEDVDADGDDILRVMVAFDANLKPLDSKKSVGIVRRLLPELEKVGEKAFPILSFIASQELKASKTATS
jgi:hypothetical protein